MNEMTYNERRKIYERAIEKYGAEAQEKMLLEEMAELQNALMKYHRDRDTVDHVAEEIADATIMLEQARIIYDVNERVSEIMTEKCARLAERLAPKSKSEVFFRGKRGEKWIFSRSLFRTKDGVMLGNEGATVNFAITKDGKQEMIASSGNPFLIPVDEKTIGEYIRRDDASGRPIFTGDVIKIQNKADIIGKVVYDEDTAAYKASLRVGNCPCLAPITQFDVLTVLGNVYDNPELVDA